jgi:uncharacterized protein (TIGR03382 family)
MRAFTAPFGVAGRDSTRLVRLYGLGEASMIRWWVLVLAVGVGSAVPAAAFVHSRTEGGAPLAWARRCIPFWINQRGSSDMVFASAQDGIEKSFATWQAVACSDLEFPYQGTTDIDEVGYDNRNVVMFRDAGWEHEAGVIALTTTTFCEKAVGKDCDVEGRILDADIELNGEEFTFTNTDDPKLIRFDLQNTVTHEAGHLIGLDHTPVPDATMYPSAPRGEIDKRTLHPDDVRGICTLYPATDSPGPCEPVSKERDLHDTGGGGGSASGCAAADGAPELPLALAFLAAIRRRRPARSPDA